MNNKWITTHLLATALFLQVACAVAQEPKRQDQTPPPGVKSILSLFGGKTKVDAKSAALAADVLESAYQGTKPPEAVRMLTAILRGSRMGPGDGWFGPAESRYSWKWLASRCQVDPTKRGITRKGFHGADAWFTRLDRDRDGAITPMDLDWSDRNPYMQVSYLVNRLFRRLNAPGDGRLTKDDLLQFFEKTAQGKDYLSADDFRDAMIAGLFGGGQPSDAPKTDVLVRGLFAGEIGSMNEGPKLNEPAPDFTLKTVDGKGTVRLAELIGPKPVVLVFGSFT